MRKSFSHFLPFPILLSLAPPPSRSHWHPKSPHLCAVTRQSWLSRWPPGLKSPAGPRGRTICIFSTGQLPHSAQILFFVTCKLGNANMHTPHHWGPSPGACKTPACPGTLRLKIHERPVNLPLQGGVVYATAVKPGETRQA